MSTASSGSAAVLPRAARISLTVVIDYRWYNVRMKYSKMGPYVLAPLSLLTFLIVTSQAEAASITPACPSVAITHVLTVGSRDLGTGGDVSRLQTFLGISPTGYFGPITKAGVITFQKDTGIVPAVGYVGPLTRAAIVKRCAPTSGNTIDVSFSASPTTGT